ncbi:MAG: desulfoferrodoxin [Lentisphaerae bacterium GWF2_52_8]|nr:MAG: desulfoferrodoxin [Lentisphaerae bacterium GWF2_52_8]
MTKRSEVYMCGNNQLTLEVLNAAGECCNLSCCGEPMKKMDEKTADTGKEKHVPVLEEGSAGVKVKVGAVPHPMEQDHYIEWIEVVNGPYVNRRYMKPGEQPEAEFYLKKQAGLVLRIYCNKHGLWKG